MVQNAAARLITSVGKYDHITPHLRNLHWLPVRYRLEFKIATLVFKCLNNLAPSYLSDLVEVRDRDRRLRSSTSIMLRVSVPKTSFGSRSFSYAAAVVWNSLPENVTKITSYGGFKSALKTHFYRLAYP